MERAALLSVSDRTGIVDFARHLEHLGFVLLVTSGTGKLLAAEGVKTLSIEEYTGQREILDGRVKTLHPKIHAGILARRDNPEHMAELQREKILPIDVVAVNLYPFLNARSDGRTRSAEEMIELIDVGGPTMLRAAAKNHHGVLPVIDPADYSEVISFLRTERSGSQGAPFRRMLAAKVLTVLAQDNLEVARYLTEESDSLFSVVSGFVLNRQQHLRYGENPHQRAALYSVLPGMLSGKRGWEQLHGKELSYNNLLDLDAALRVIRNFTDSPPFAAILKHLNPCGAAYGTSLLDALWKAKRCDPRSHFGGIIAFNDAVDLKTAQEIREDFAEIVVAPRYHADALAELQTSKNLRIVSFGEGGGDPFEIRSVDGGILIQEADRMVSTPLDAEIMTRRAPSDEEWRDITLAWKLCAHVKSNAITIVKDGLLIGVGGGQMSRVDSVELALSKARLHGHDLNGAVAASDAFFPFPDGPETLALAGVRAIIAPRGAKRDHEAVAVCNERAVSLLFTSDRHFRH